MAKRFLDVIGLEYFWNKIKALLNNKSDKGHTHSASDVLGLSKVATTNDFNDLKNLPLYHSPFNITWDGDTTDLVSAAIIGIPDSEAISYYQLSNTPPDSNIVEGSKVTITDLGEPITFTVLSENIIDNGNNNYHLEFPEATGIIPLVFCISTPDTITLESDGTSATITFDQSGVYFLNLDGNYISSFSKEGKTLDKEFIPDIYQEKLQFPQLDMGYFSSNSSGNFISNYIYLVNNASNPNIDLQKLAYNITTDGFVLPVIMNTTVKPVDGTITLKVATGIDSSGNLTDSISIDISSKTPLYNTKTYFLVAIKDSNGTWSGWIVGKTDSPVDTTPTSGSENLITSGGVYTELNKKANADSTYTKTEIDNKLGSVFHYKGTVDSYNDLPSANEIGDVWNITNAYSLGDINIKAGDNVAWTGTNWDILSGTVDLSEYALSNHIHTTATTSANGFLSSEDKAKLDTVEQNANAYTHPSTHPASMITGLATVATTGNFNDLTGKPTIPSSLPANGGNADTVDNYHIRTAEEGDTGLAGYITFIV